MEKIISLTEEQNIEPLDAKNFDDDNQIYVLMGEHLYTYEDEFVKEDGDEVLNGEEADDIEYITDGESVYRLLG